MAEIFVLQFESLIDFEVFQRLDVCAARDTRLFAAVPLQNENHSTLNGSFRAAAPAHGAMPAQA